MILFECFLTPGEDSMQTGYQHLLKHYHTLFFHESFKNSMRALSIKIELINFLYSSLTLNVITTFFFKM